MEMTCFKLYDVRGMVGVDLDENIARRIGHAFARVMQPGTVVIGRDCRTSSAALQAALIEGLKTLGCHVIDIGLAGTEEVYFATEHFDAGGGIEVTASHNPINYNGMKLVGPGSRPLTDAEFRAVRAEAEKDAPTVTAGRPRGTVRRASVRRIYARHLTDMVDARALAPLRVVVNAGNGVAGAAFDSIATELASRGAPVNFIRVNHEPDGRFPQGIPNPLMPENRGQTAEIVVRENADFGVAWDGDFDRCFFFDETGAFVDGEHVVALLATACLADHPGATIVHDPRVIWNIQSQVMESKGRLVPAQVGHVHMKTAMREYGAVYGGEMSAHHYFRDFMYCDSGMIPWLKIAALMSARGLRLSELVKAMRMGFPSSGEINLKVHDINAALVAIGTAYEPSAIAVDRMDGIGLSFTDWRFNLRGSSTEPYLRLNVETRADVELVKIKVDEIKAALATHLA